MQTQPISTDVIKATLTSKTYSLTKLADIEIELMRLIALEEMELPLCPEGEKTDTEILNKQCSHFGYQTMKHLDQSFGSPLAKELVDAISNNISQLPICAFQAYNRGCSDYKGFRS